MKKLIIATILMSAASVNADAADKPNSIDLCYQGKSIYLDGFDVDTVIEWLNYSLLPIEDKKIILECYTSESKKV